MLSKKVNIDGQGHHRNRRLFWILGAAGYLAFLVWLYWPAMDSFFANDDWVILYHNAPISPGQWWKYFSFHAVWFYRPLQSMQFGLTYYAAGLNHFVYNLELLILHLIFCGVGWVFLRRLFSTGVATISIMMFSISWIYADIMFWKANYNSLQFAITTVSSALAFLLYIDTRLKKWLVATLALSILNCFTKESAVGLPLMLGTVWFCRFLQWKWHTMDVPANTLPPVSLPAGPKKVVSQFAIDMVPVSVLVILFAIAHRVFFVYIETNYLPGYNFAKPWQAYKQWMHGTAYSVGGVLYDPVILERFPQIQQFIIRGIEKWWFLPPLLFALCWFKRNVTAMFGLMFAVMTQFPTFALETYRAGRYYYMPALGGAVFLIEWLINPLKTLTRRDASLKQRIIGYVACVFLTWFFVSNIVFFQRVMSNDHMESTVVNNAYQQLRKNGGKLPAGAMLVLGNVPNGFSANGLGISEMFYFATGRQDVAVVTDSELLNEEEKRRFESRKDLYYLDVISSAPKIMRVDKK